VHVIICSAGLPFHRRARLSSNVRPHKQTPMHSLLRKSSIAVLPQAAIAVLIGAACTAAIAQYVRASGEYRSSTMNVVVVVLDANAGVAAVETTVTQGACSGTLAGIGKFEGRKLLVRPYVQEAASASCELRAEFNSDWSEVRTHAKGCGAYSGAVCGWEGQRATRR
jgi:hypothetical protein